MMRVAVVTPFLPWPADTGGKLRSYYLLRGLALTHEVHLFTVHRGLAPDPGPLATLFSRVESFQLPSTRRLFAAPLAFLSKKPRSVSYFQTPESLSFMRGRLAAGYDLLICDEICMAEFLEEIPNVGPVPRLVIRHKIDHLHYREMAMARRSAGEKLADWLEAVKLERFERDHMPGFQAATACSPEDAHIVREQGRGLPVAVIVNGADTDYFTPQPRPDPLPTVLLLGTMYYYPNVDSTLYFFNEIYPALRNAVPDVQVLIVGHNPPPEVAALGKLPGVTVTGSVKDVRPYMARSWVLAVPLRLGGGTRLKIMEAMAAGLPVVSTIVGAQGIDAVEGEDFLLADDPAEFAARTARLLKDAGLRQALSRNGRRRVEDCYSWQALGQRYVLFCENIASPA
jgi:polysaccharide biosynthesis protein PslH